jgi:hypothetical protein
MKKRNLKSLELNKKSIAIIGINVKGGKPTFSEVVKCKTEPLSDPLEPKTVTEYASRCNCGSIIC